MVTPKEYGYAQANLAAKGSKAVAHARLPQENAKPGWAQRPETAQVKTAYTLSGHTVNSQARILARGACQVVASAAKEGKKGSVEGIGGTAQHPGSFFGPSRTKNSSRLRTMDAVCCETTVQGSRQ